MAKSDTVTSGSAVTTNGTSTTTSSTLPDLTIRPLDLSSSAEIHAVREFCLNVLMQRVRLSNTFVYSSPQWLTMYILAISWSIYRFQPHVTNDWGRWLFLAAAISALFLVGVDYFTYRYYEAETKADHDRDAFLQNPANVLVTAADDEKDVGGGGKKSKGTKSGGGETTKSRCVVAYFAGNLVGTCLVRPVNLASGTEMEISHWNVKARYRNKGLGGDLLTDTLSYCKSTAAEGAGGGILKSVVAKTTSIQRRAIATLKQEGFQLVDAKPVQNPYYRFVGVKEQTWRLDLDKWAPAVEDDATT